MNHFFSKIAVAFAMIAPTASLADWNGYYAGLGFGQTSNGTVEVETLLSETDLDDSNMSGAFMGYLTQRGDMVIGGELAFSATPDAGFDDAVYGADIDGVVSDFKIRVGYALDKIQPYAIGGTSFMTLQGDNVTDLLAVGFSAGLGVDYMISDNFIVGAEYLARFGSGVAEDGFGNEYDFDIRLDSLAVRAAYKF